MYGQGCVCFQAEASDKNVFLLLLLKDDAEAQGMAHPELMDPVSDLKLNQIDIVDAVRERQSLLQVILWYACVLNALALQAHRRAVASYILFDLLLNVISHA